MACFSSSSRRVSDFYIFPNNPTRKITRNINKITLSACPSLEIAVGREIGIVLSDRVRQTNLKLRDKILESTPEIGRHLNSAGKELIFGRRLDCCGA